jgi:hypothetical protein
MTSPFTDPMAPLTTCAPYTVLLDVFSRTGDSCSPPTDDEGDLPPGWCSLTIDGITRFFDVYHLDLFGRTLADVLRHHVMQPPADTDPTA